MLNFMGQEIARKFVDLQTCKILGRTSGLIRTFVDLWIHKFPNSYIIKNADVATELDFIIQKFISLPFFRFTRVATYLFLYKNTVSVFFTEMLYLRFSDLVTNITLQSLKSH